ncbi:MAG: carbon-nitrogen hydrolase family protein, partial [Haliea sp.]
MNQCRVAAVQFATGTDLSRNLATCLRMIHCAIREGAELIVLPEFCNHLSWYDDYNHAWRVALAEDGPFLQAIAEKARDNRCHIVINVSLRRPPSPDKPQPITVTSILFGPGGKQLLQAHKQTMMGHENDYFVRADKITPVVDTVVGKLGLFSCRDGVTCETPRSLALRGAGILCDSLNSFALDEASLHVPARAVENKVFLVAANKIGPLIPEPLLVPVSEATHIPVEFLMGAGESQIVAPDGRVLARGPRAEEAIVVADINLDEAHNKQRPDGSSQFLNRRPSLYRPLAEAPQGEYCVGGADAIRAALYSPSQQSGAALTEVVHLIRDLDTALALLVLPELFCFG